MPPEGTPKPGLEVWKGETTKRGDILKHYCHAEGCKILVPPKMLMCRPHWFQVPKHIRNAIWREYRPGQEIDKKPSEDYLEIMKAAIESIG